MNRTVKYKRVNIMNDHANERNKQVIENYQEQEKMMILIYAQWCLNNDLDPVELYQTAYPDQLANDALQEVLTLTVPKKEADEVTDEVVIQALQLFGNDDLAFIVQDKIDQKKNNSK